MYIILAINNRQKTGMAAPHHSEHQTVKFSITRTVYMCIIYM